MRKTQKWSTEIKRELQIKEGVQNEERGKSDLQENDKLEKLK